MFSAYLHWWDMHPRVLILIMLGVAVWICIQAKYL